MHFLLPSYSKYYSTRVVGLHFMTSKLRGLNDIVKNGLHLYTKYMVGLLWPQALLISLVAPYAMNVPERTTNRTVRWGLTWARCYAPTLLPRQRQPSASSPPITLPPPQSTNPPSATMGSRSSRKPGRTSRYMLHGLKNTAGRGNERLVATLTCWPIISR